VDKFKSIVFFILTTAAAFMDAQSIDLPIISAKHILYSSKVYIAGIQQLKSTSLKVYQLSPQLKLMDSVQVELKTTKPLSFVELDTLSDHLNVFVQEQKSTKVSVYRFTKKLKLVASSENESVTTINALGLFAHDYYHLGSFLYTIKKNTDSAGNNFFLHKYKAIDPTKINKYEVVWQFPFERKFIQSIKIIDVKFDILFCYVNINSGKKAGQWLLQINANSGKLLHANKISSDNSFYSSGKLLFDTLSTSFVMIGQKLVKSATEAYSPIITPKLPNQLLGYYIKLDTTGALLDQQEFKLLISNQKLMKPGVKKVEDKYLFKVQALTGSLSEDNINLELDFYKNDDASNCLSYCNTLTKKINFEPVIKLDNPTLTNNLELEKFYFNTLEADPTGKVCFDSLANLPNWFYGKPADSKLHFATEENAKPFWYLKKQDAKTKAWMISKLFFNGKIYSSKLVYTSPNYSYAIPVSNKIVVLSDTENATRIQLLE
jgi:hypothetical protein